MEMNKRQDGDPWSLRQLGVYQQISISTGNSTWIILQATESVRTQLEQSLKLRLETDREDDRAGFLFHLIFLSSTAWNWQEYLEYLHLQVSIFVSATSSAETPS